MTSPSQPQESQTQSHSADSASPFGPDYQVAHLPRQEVEKIRNLEEELRGDVGEEVVLIAYKKDAPAPSPSPSGSSPPERT